MSSTFRFSPGWAAPALLILWSRLGRCSENQLETVMARRSRPRLTQCTSEVMGTSEKSARSRHTGALLHSKSFTMLRISWRSACRIIPRMFSKVETCFFLWEGGWTEESGMMSVHGQWMHRRQRSFKVSEKEPHLCDSSISGKGQTVCFPCKQFKLTWLWTGKYMNV